MLKIAPRLAALLAAALCLSACAAKTSAERAGVDQEISRNILWRYRDRFPDIRVSCEDRHVVLEGRVPDSKSATEAIQIAMSEARGGKVESRLEVRPR